jgi:hypothetical protein
VQCNQALRAAAGPSIPAGHRGAKQTENAKHREHGWSEEEASLLRSTIYDIGEAEAIILRGLFLTGRSDCLASLAAWDRACGLKCPRQHPTTVTAVTVFGSVNLYLTVVVTHWHKNVCVCSRPPIGRVDTVGVAGFSKAPP